MMIYDLEYNHVIIEDEDMYRKLSKNGINHVIDNFNFDQSFIELENMFKKVLQ